MLMKKDRLFGPQVPVQKPTTLENMHKWLKLVGEMVTSAVIIATVTSVVIGTIMVRIYLSSFSISISPLDTLSASSLQIFMVFFLTLMGGAVFLFLAPLAATYIVQPETRESLPNLFGRRYIPRDTLRPKTVAARQPRPALLLTRGTFPKFLGEYAMFYFPTLVVIWIMPIDIYFEVPVEKIYSWAIPSSIVLAALVLYIFKLKGRAEKLVTYSSLIQINRLTVLWVLFLEIGLLGVWEHNVTQSITPGNQMLIEAGAVSFIGMACHAFTAWARFSIRVLIGFALLVIGSLYVYPGYAAIGAEALREAQLGGGTLISYTVMGPRATTPGPASGCLVLATSSYVLIGDLNDNSCSRLTRFSFTASEAKVRPVRVFSRNEINISELPGG
jgi:hypothetical protein